MSELPKTRTETTVALWNPNAAANWSLPFSPVFGAYLHALNWRSLGEAQRAEASMKWVYVGIALLFLYLAVGFFVSDEKAAEGIARLAGLVYLLSWYFGSAKAQAKYVKERFGTSYPRKSWGRPLLIAVGCAVGFFVLAVLVGILLGAIGAA
jgi:hypothetical protein